MSIFFTKFQLPATNRDNFMMAGLRGSFVSALAFAISAISLVVASQPADSGDEVDDREAVTLVAANASRR